MGMVRDNPVFARTAIPRWLRRGGRWRWWLAGAGYLAGSLVVLYLNCFPPTSQPGSDAVFLAWTWAVLAIAVLPAVTSQAITRERRQGTWDALLLSRLRWREIYGGKLLGIAIPLSAVGLFFLSTCVTLLVMEGSPRAGEYAFSVVGAYAVGLAGSLVSGSVGLFFSTYCENEYIALGCTYLVLGTVAIGISVIS